LILNEFLNRLRELKDFQNHSTRKSLAQRLVRILKEFEINPAYRLLCLPIMEEAIGTCGDRVNLRLDQLECQLKILKSTSLTHFEMAQLALGMHWMGELEKIARQKISTLRFVDEVEVYLIYQVFLAKVLKLPIETEGMLYANLSGVTKDDLDLAKDTLLNQLTNQEALAHCLVAFEPWKKKIESDCSEELFPLNDKFQKRMEQLEMNRSHDHPYLVGANQIQQEREKEIHDFILAKTKQWLRQNHQVLMESYS